MSFRLRPDLQFQRERYQGREFWVVKDPLRLKYFRFDDEEYWLLRELDANLTLEELQHRFEVRFAPQKVSPRQLHRLIGLAHRNGLILADKPGQGIILAERQQNEQRRRWWSLASNLLYLRLRGWDPHVFLTALNRHAGFLFSKGAVVLGALLGIAAILLVGSQWQEFTQRLPSSGEFFGPSNWLALAVTLAGVKILHELGHGLACRRFGGECHEMGVLLLCFTPCLYCDVTDSWIISSKWKRAAIGAAGMYAELWLAALATFVWWHSTPGAVHHAALNVMFVGSVSTLLFNANPLMRYDGYYILSDLVEIPNLSTQAEGLLRQFTCRYLLAVKQPASPFLPARGQGWLAGYAVASAVYRWSVTAGILWFLYNITEPYGFKILGQLVALAAVAGLVAIPLYRVGKFLYEHWTWERNDMKIWPATLRIGLLTGAIAALACLPLPNYVRCAVRLQPEDAAFIYVDVPGQITETLVQPGDHVVPDQPLIKLRNLELELAVARLKSQCELQSATIASLRQRALANASSSGEIAQAEQSLIGLREELARRQAQGERLVIRSPRKGVVKPAPTRLASAERGAELRSWLGHPLESRNRGALLAASDLVCVVGNPGRWQAMLAVDGQDVAALRPGQRVDLLPAARPGERILTQLDSIAQDDMKSSPAAMSAKSGGTLLTRTDGQGQERPLFVTYRASAHFANDSILLASGGGGQARIHAGHLTLAARAWRFLRHTFHFQL